MKQVQTDKFVFDIYIVYFILLIHDRLYKEPNRLRTSIH